MIFGHDDPSRIAYDNCTRLKGAVMSNQPEPRNVTERMPELAAKFVETCKSAGVPLDYLPRTLPMAEKYVKSNPGEAARMAAYFGEVLRRDTRGFWFDTE